MVDDPEELAREVLANPAALQHLVRLLRQPETAAALDGVDLGPLGASPVPDVASARREVRQIVVAVTPSGRVGFLHRLRESGDAYVALDWARVYRQPGIAAADARCAEKRERRNYAVGDEPAYVVLDIVIPSFEEAWGRAAAKGPYNIPLGREDAS